MGLPVEPYEALSHEKPVLAECPTIGWLELLGTNTGLLEAYRTHQMVRL